jgi:hypothetical protein
LATVSAVYPASFNVCTALAVGASITGSWPVNSRIAVAASHIIVVLPVPGFPAIPGQKIRGTQNVVNRVSLAFVASHKFALNLPCVA